MKVCRYFKNCSIIASNLPICMKKLFVFSLNHWHLNDNVHCF